MVSKEAKELFRISCFPGLQFRPHEISNQQGRMGTRLTAVDFFMRIVLLPPAKFHGKKSIMPSLISQRFT